MSHSRLTLVLVLVVGALALALLLAWRQGQQPPVSPLAGRPAADYVFTRLAAADQRFTPAEWRGRKYLVSFFASWCLPCRAEHPVIMRLQKETGVTMLGVAYRDRDADVQQVLAELGNPYELVVTDLSGRGGKAWGIKSVPETFLMNEDGIVIWHHRGVVTPQAVAAEIMPLLQASSQQRQVVRPE